MGIHVEYYPVEVSFIKCIATDEFNYLQLRVLINGGNRVALEFFAAYDLQHATVQKRYNTVAAQAFRDKIKRQLESGYLSSDQTYPTFDEGRQPLRSGEKVTRQIKPYSSINCKWLSLYRPSTLTDLLTDWMITWRVRRAVRVCEQSGTC